MKLSRYILPLLFLCFANQSIAQTRDKPNAIGLFGVKTEYIGDLGHNVFKFGNDFRGGVGLSFDRFLNRFFDVGFYASFSSIGLDRGITTYANFEQWNNRSELGNEVQNFEINRLLNFHIHGRFKILNSERWRLVPYVGLAAGMAFNSGIHTNYLDADGNIRTMFFFNPNNEFVPRNNARIVDLEQRGIGTAYTLSGIIGLDFRVSRHFSIRYQAVGSWTSRDDFDFYVSGANDWQIQHNIGIVYRFSGRRPSAQPKRKRWICHHPAWCEPTPAFALSTLPKVDTTEIRTEPIVTQPDTFFFPAILLEFGDFALSVKAQNQLDSIADWLIELPEYHTHISGHTCILGCEIYNQQLSKRRAGIVKDHLIKRGVPKNRITKSYYGDTNPIADNETLDGRALNRRVGIKVFGVRQ